MTLLHRAADVAQVEIIKYLMEIGADAAAKTFRGGDTPLHLAAQHGHVELCDFLLTHHGTIDPPTTQPGDESVAACVEIKFTARSS